MLAAALSATVAPATPELASGASYLAALNLEQRRAVCFGTEGGSTPGGPLLVIAGAGSGKTNTLVHRVAHLIACGADPQRILLLTFSRRAAADMERRAAGVLRDALAGRTGAPTSLPWSGTFHAVGARLLRDCAERIGLDPQFTVHDRSDSEDLLALVRHDLGLDATEQRFPAKSTCLAIYSRVVNSEASLEAVVASSFGWCASWAKELRALFGDYVEAKQAQNVLDFDDLLLYWAQMVEEPGLGVELGNRFDHVLIDEYQDTNRLQARILLAMKPDGRGVTVVGDDAQAIYGFRAATVRNILDFPRQFAEPAAVVTLQRNYRSSEPILHASNAVIEGARERFTKNLWSGRVSAVRPELVIVRDQAEQAQCVAERILEHREAGVPLRAQAVLFRTSSHAAPLELELGRRRIPFVKYGGLKFLDAAHVKDALGILRFADNPRGRVAGFRTLKLVPGVGPATARRIMDAIAAVAEPATVLHTVPGPTGPDETWRSFVALIDALRAPSCPWPAALERVLAWYEPQLDRLYDDAHPRRADLAQLKLIAATYPSRERFLTELTLDPPGAVSDEAGIPHRDDDYLVLSTIHSAKGQEWKTVHVLNVVDGCIPSDMATGSAEEIEEERRVLYVAMTRAKDALYLMIPQRFYVLQQSGQGDRHVHAARSRFLPDSVLDRFALRTWPAYPDPAAHVAEPIPAINIAAKLRAAWR
ncbi:MAG: ATP-dependent helicase [Casimicrobiaceae bacterium]